MWGLTPTDQLSQNEIDAAAEVQVDRLNVQQQDRIRWEPSFAVVRSFVDQLERSGDLSGRTLDKMNERIDRAERFSERGHGDAAAAQLRAIARQLHGRTFDDLEDALEDLADDLDRHGHHGNGGH